jgi:hypothetical protein
MRQHTCPRPYRRTRCKQVCDAGVVRNPVQGGNVARDGTKLPVFHRGVLDGMAPGMDLHSLIRRDARTATVGRLRASADALRFTASRAHGPPGRGSPVGCTQLAHGLGEVIAHGSLGQVQTGRDIGVAQPVPSHAQHLTLPLGERVGLAPCVGGEGWIDRPPPAVDGANGVGQGRRRGVLEQVAANSGVQARRR